MSDELDLQNLGFDERAEIERARPPSPQLAKRVLEVLRKESSPANPTLTENNIRALKVAGITWEELLETGMVLLNSTMIVDDEVVAALKFEYGTMIKRSEAGELVEQPWRSQGGNEVHQQDNDMPKPPLNVEELFHPDPNDPFFVRLRGFDAECETAPKTLDFLSRSGRMEWDWKRIEHAADQFRDGPRDRARSGTPPRLRSVPKGDSET